MLPSLVSKELSHRFVFFLLLSLLSLLILKTPVESAVPVGSELEISSESSSWTRNPDVGMAASGDFFVVWMGQGRSRSTTIQRFGG